MWLSAIITKPESPRDPCGCSDRLRQPVRGNWMHAEQRRKSVEKTGEPVAVAEKGGLGAVTVEHQMHPETSPFLPSWDGLHRAQAVEGEVEEVGVSSVEEGQSDFGRKSAGKVQTAEAHEQRQGDDGNAHLVR